MKIDGQRQFKMNVSLVIDAIVGCVVRSNASKTLSVLARIWYTIQYIFKVWLEDRQTWIQETNAATYPPPKDMYLPVLKQKEIKKNNG